MKKETILLVISIFMLPAVLFADDKKPQKPRIEIPADYEEIIILDNGKEVQRKRVEKRSEEEKNIVNSIRQKIFKKLGVNSEGELIKRKLWSKYKEQSSKELKIVDTPTKEPNKVKFIDETGRVVKEIQLGEEKIVRTVGEIENEWKSRSLNLKGQTDNIGDSFSFGNSDPGEELKVRKSKSIFINKLKDHAALAVTEDILTSAGPAIGFSDLIYLNSIGEELWTHKFPKGRSILSVGAGADAPQISDDGNIVTAMTSDSAEGPGGEEICVFDKSGKEILTYPKDGETATAPRPSYHKISPNGRYLCYRIEKHTYLTEPPSGQTIINRDEESNKTAILEKLKKTVKTVFWDLKENTTWETEAYLVYAISDDGIAKVSNPWTSGGSKLIDVKPNLRKP